MNERIKILRKTLGLSGEKFGEHLGVSRAAISNIEGGSRNVTDQMFKSICREFNVDETWLRTGEGDMFKKHSDFDEIHSLIESTLSEDDDFIKSIYKNLSKASPEFIAMLKEFVDNIYQDTHSHDC